MRPHFLDFAGKCRRPDVIYPAQLDGLFRPSRYTGASNED